ncbi:hydrogen peroxide-inducible genes activator [Bartonella tamiae]|uniref:HTH lysR-type domain-containing protein n=1 Tax=Bartonella tamiae Th239 TaxID=1094558 RepID=J0R478_9HYPH|nr:hydrogen peroxide-inducible genes activator [Bartonella tamiae]EJF90424.1 hypothetical protein ME5_00825 [Bartonella tamiae Th239]EJF93632.1 hypothetical protein MEG_01056 [Bartonella tamiae Th307]
MFTVRQLRYFQVLAKKGHFGEASEKLGISQPALSVQIAEMEKTAGAPLFERSSKRILLTPLGKNFQPLIDDILLRLAALVDVASNYDGPLSHPLKLGIIPTIAPYLLPLLLPQTHRLYPKLNLVIQEAKTDNLLEMLRVGHVDAIIAALPIECDELISEPLFKDQFYLAVAKDEFVHFNKTIDQADLDNHKLLLLEEGHCLREQTLQACQTKEYRHDITASSLTTLLQLVENGIGITIIPQIAVSTEMRQENLKLIPFCMPVPYREVHLVWRRRSQRLEDFKLFAQMVKSLADSILREAKNFIT